MQNRCKQKERGGLVTTQVAVSIGSRTPGFEPAPNVGASQRARTCAYERLRACARGPLSMHGRLEFSRSSFIFVIYSVKEPTPTQTTRASWCDLLH